MFCRFIDRKIFDIFTVRRVYINLYCIFSDSIQVYMFNMENTKLNYIGVCFSFWQSSPLVPGTQTHLIFYHPFEINWNVSIYAYNVCSSTYLDSFGNRCTWTRYGVSYIKYTTYEYIWNHYSNTVNLKYTNKMVTIIKLNLHLLPVRSTASTP